MATEHLKKVMAQIDSILKENDLAGVVVIQDREDMEYLYKLDASWNCITTEGNGIRIKAAAATGPASEKEKLRLGVGVTVAFARFSDQMNEDMMMVTSLFTSAGIQIEQTMRRK